MQGWKLRIAASAAIGTSVLLLACGGGSPPEATPTPHLPLTAENLAEQLRDAGAPVGETASYNESTDPDGLLGRPGQYLSRINFADLRIRPLASDVIEVKDGGAIEVFASPADAARRLDSLEGIAGDLATRRHVEGRVLLRLSDALTVEEASVYEGAFRTVVRGD